jgi:hypothetical protein
MFMLGLLWSLWGRAWLVTSPFPVTLAGYFWKRRALRACRGVVHSGYARASQRVCHCILPCCGRL